jgi:hypothetical protein
MLQQTTPRGKGMIIEGRIIAHHNNMIAGEPAFRLDPDRSKA